MTEQKENYNVKQYMEKIITDQLEKFKKFTEWTTKDKSEFKKLLDILRMPFDQKGEAAKYKGDKLEAVVEFIIRKSYFYEIYKNVHTQTNEIDEVIVFSDRGRQALKTFGISRDLIPIKEDVFLGECKNYKKNLDVTYVGKFYSLMTVTGVSTGIIFTQKGLTGRSEGFKDAYGLTKVLRMVELNKDKNSNFCILTFTEKDYDKLLEGYSFFDLVKVKQYELQLASDYSNFLKDHQHEAEDKIKKIVHSI